MIGRITKIGYTICLHKSDQEETIVDNNKILSTRKPNLSHESTAEKDAQ